jgi:hypothetical protein
MHATTLFSLLTAAAAANAACTPPTNQLPATGAVKCPVVFDGRVKTASQLSDFDSASTSIFNPDYVKGQNLKWSQILQFPETDNAHFDDTTYKPFEVTLSDASIFQTQRGFRRAGLQFKGDTNNGSPGSTGVKTIHFSIKLDPQRALNLSHEYLLVWHETAACMPFLNILGATVTVANIYRIDDANQFNFEAGAILGQSSLPKDTYKVLDRSNKQIWSTPILKDVWQNFAITLDFNKKCVPQPPPSFSSA